MAEKNHTKMYGICENKCMVEVAPKTKTDEIEERVEVLEAEFDSSNFVHKGDPENKDTWIAEDIYGQKTFISSPLIKIPTNMGDIPTSTSQIGYHCTSEDDEWVGVLNWGVQNNENVFSALRARKWDSSVDDYAQLTLWKNLNGTQYAEAPTPTTIDFETGNVVVDKAPTGNEIITASALANFGGVVHTANDETINGNKTFNGYTTLACGKVVNVGNIGIDIYNTSNTFLGKVGYMTTPDANVPYKGTYLFCNGDNLTLSTLGGYSYLNKSPLASADGTEIVTAGWVNDKIAGKITISSSYPSGGSNGDIWFKY